MVLQNILCYACGEYVQVEFRRTIAGAGIQKRHTKPKSTDYDVLAEARLKNNCPKCGKSLELLANLAAGRGRLAIIEEGWKKNGSPFPRKWLERKKKKKKKETSNLPYIQKAEERQEIIQEPGVKIEEEEVDEDEENEEET